MHGLPQFSSLWLGIVDQSNNLKSTGIGMHLGTHVDKKDSSLFKNTEIELAAYQFSSVPGKTILKFSINHSHNESGVWNKKNTGYKWIFSTNTSTYVTDLFTISANPPTGAKVFDPLIGDISLHQLLQRIVDVNENTVVEDFVDDCLGNSMFSAGVSNNSLLPHSVPNTELYLHITVAGVNPLGNQKISSNLRGIYANTQHFSHNGNSIVYSVKIPTDRDVIFCKAKECIDESFLKRSLVVTLKLEGIFSTLQVKLSQYTVELQRLNQKEHTTGKIVSPVLVRDEVLTPGIKKPIYIDDVIRVNRYGKPAVFITLCAFDPHSVELFEDVMSVIEN